jgi:hypothetical protein
VELLDREQAPHLDYSGRIRTVYDSILYPSRTDYFDASLYAAGTPPYDKDVPAVEVSPTMRQGLGSGQKYVVAYGRGTFYDALGEHWFQFCRWITFADPQSRLAFTSRDCVDYNKVGDGDYQKKSN